MFGCERAACRFFLLLFSVIFLCCYISKIWPSRQKTKQITPVIWNYNKTCLLFVCVCVCVWLRSAGAPSPQRVLPTLAAAAAAANVTGAMQHGEVCATAWWSVLFILKWGSSSGRYRGEWNNKHGALETKASVGGTSDSEMATPPYKVALRTLGRVIIWTVASRRALWA